MKKNYKEKIDQPSWMTEMFNINDYKTIIENYWTENQKIEIDNFKTFENHFSIDIGIGKKKDVLKWISYFNSYRNQVTQ